jgi:hypothetical protein
MKIVFRLRSKGIYQKHVKNGWTTIGREANEDMKRTALGEKTH